jgi:hypothetical protein
VAISRVSRDIGEDAHTAWCALNNPWNAQGLRNGVDYRQSITIDPTSFPANTVIAWEWPDRSNWDDVWSYPAVIYGSQAGGFYPSPNFKTPTPTRVKDLSALTASVDLTLGGDTGSYNVLLETHLTATPKGGQLFEFGIFLHAPDHLSAWLLRQKHKHDFVGDGFKATIVIDYEEHDPPFIMVLPTVPTLKARIDIKPMLDLMMAKGVVSGDEFLLGYELGAEPRKNAGTLTINSLAYEWR